MPAQLERDGIKASLMGMAFKAPEERWGIMLRSTPGTPVPEIRSCCTVASASPRWSTCSQERTN